MTTIIVDNRDIEKLREEVGHVHDCIESVKTALLGDLKTKAPGLIFEHERMKKTCERLDGVYWKLYGVALVVSVAAPLIYKWIGDNLLGKHP